MQLNGSRKVIGVLRGYDVTPPPPPPTSSFRADWLRDADDARVQVFLNIVLDDAVEEKDGGEKVRIGTVVIRGNSVVMLEVCLLRQCVSPLAERFLMCGIGIGENKLKRRVRVVGVFLGGFHRYTKGSGGRQRREEPLVHDSIHGRYKRKKLDEMLYPSIVVSLRPRTVVRPRNFALGTSSDVK